MRNKVSKIIFILLQTVGQKFQKVLLLNFTGNKPIELILHLKYLNEYCISSNKHPSALILFQNLWENGTYFPGRKINHIKFQNIVNFSIKTKRIYKTSPSVNQKDIKYVPSWQEAIKVYSKNTGTRKKVCQKLIIKTPGRRNRCSSNVFIVNLELSHTLSQCLFCWLWTGNYRLG